MLPCSSLSLILSIYFLSLTFSSSPLTSHKLPPAFLSHVSSLVFSLMSSAFHFHFSHCPVVTFWFFTSYMWSLYLSFPRSLRIPFSDHMLTFCLLVPSGFPSIFSSFCLDWFFLRSNILLINNVQETGCFYNSEITLLSPTPPWNLSRLCEHKNKGRDSNRGPFGPK